MQEADSATDLLFHGKTAAVRSTYERLLDTLAPLGPFTVEAKKTSIHLVRSSAFAGVHPRKSFLYLNLRLDRPLHGQRVAKSEQVSKNRWHNEIRLETPDQIDGELRGWLQEAYALS